MAKEYELRFLPLFEEDLNEIVDYITNVLQNEIEEHTSELQSHDVVHLVCRLLLEIGRASCRERV